jgi:thiol-disulfide isomerase/thioredoxin
MRLLKLALLSLLLTICAFAQAPEQRVVGHWLATISPVNKAGEKQFDAAFEFVVERSGSGLSAALYNGPERMNFTGAQFAEGVLKLAIAHYDGVITATLDDKGELNGDYTRQTSMGIRHYPLHAVRTANDASVPETASAASTAGASLAGDWVLTFTNDTGTDKVAPAVFHEDAKTGTVNGTIAPVSGDFGLMSGKVTKGEGGVSSFSLSRFDGIHVLLMEGQFDTADSLHGTLNKTDKFTAVRKSAAAQSNTAEATPDAESITKVKDPTEVFHFRGVDSRTGKIVTESDFKGKPVIVDIFGTWCPNCHDEAPVLVDLYKRYHADGLEIVGLSYEYTDDAKRNAKMVDIYRKKFGIDFPLLVSGTTEQGQIAKTLPQLVGFGAYPTTIFIGRDGQIRKIHAGFEGPATGQLDEVKQRFDENVRELVKK